MKNITFLKSCLLLAAVMTLFSCEKYSEDDDWGSKKANSTLVVRTRAAMAVVDEEAKVSYPVNIYIFNGSGVCVGVETISSDADELKLSLPEGRYDVYAIAGAEADDYELPTKENAMEDAVIAIKDGHAHGDLMTAGNSVSLAYGEENTLTLSLERKVMMLETVTINNVPSNVTAVSVTVAPLYENIMLNGGYSGDNGEYTVSLAKGETGNTWKSEAGVYLLEASAAATVKVSFTTDDKTISYSYTCPEELKANYKINISGTYSGDGVELNGSIIGVTWAGTTNVTFEFSDNGSSESGVTGDDETPSGDVGPEVGTMYEGCYVLRKEQQDEKTVVTLMSPTSENEWSFDVKGGQEAVKNALNVAIEKLTEELSVAGISGWRLPNIDEMEYIKNHPEQMEQVFFVTGVNFSMANWYFYLTDEDNVARYKPSLSTDNADKSLASGTSNYLYAFTTLTFTK